MKKWIVRIVLGVVVIVVLAVGVAWLMIDSIAKKGIQQGGEYALGVPSDVNEVKLSLLNGSLMIDKLKISNPQGYASPHLMQTGKFDLEVRSASVVNGPVEVRKFVLDGLDVNIEQTAKGNNISAVLDNIKRLCGGSSDSGAKPQPAEGSGGTKVRVGKLVIRNVVVHVILPVAILGKELTIKLPAIEMDDVTKDAPEGVTVGGLIRRIVPAVLASVVENSKSLLPADLSGILNRDLAGTAQALGGRAAKLVQQVGGEPAAIMKQNADKLLKGLPKDIVPKDIVPKGVGDPLKGILGGAKPKEPAKTN